MKRTARVTAFVVGALFLATAVAALGYSLGSGVLPQYSAVSSSDASKAVIAQPVSEAGQLAYGGISSQEAATVAGATDGSSQASAPPSDRLLIVTASMDVRVDDLDESLDALRSSVAKNGGEVAELSISSGESPIGPVPLDASASDSEPHGPSSAIVTIRVPAERLDALRDEVGSLGTVVSESASASDVTEQAIDLEARLRNLRAEEARLRTFLARTSKVSELLEVERELARVRGEIESMDAQLTYLERQAARATLTVSLSEPGPVVRPATGSWGLREAITRGIQATASMVSTMITVAIPLTFVALVVFAIGYPVRTLLRRRGRSTTSAAGEQQEDGEA